MLRQNGFTFADTLITVAVFGILSATAVPVIGTGMRRFHLNSAVRQVATQLRTARLAAVSANRTMRVRFNCPAAGQFRIVEITGNSSIDNDADRCSETSYPFPDADAANVPDKDGPVVTLGAAITFGTVQNLDFAPTGRVTAVTGATPVSINVSDVSRTVTLTITAAGRVQLP